MSTAFHSPSSCCCASPFLCKRIRQALMRFSENPVALAISDIETGFPAAHFLPRLFHPGCGLLSLRTLSTLESHHTYISTNPTFPASSWVHSKRQRGA